MTPQFALSLFKIGRVLSTIGIVIDLLALIVLESMNGDLKIMLQCLAMNLGSFYICEHAIEYINKKLKGKDEKQ